MQLKLPVRLFVSIIIATLLHLPAAALLAAPAQNAQSTAITSAPMHHDPGDDDDCGSKDPPPGDDDGDEPGDPGGEGSETPPGGDDHSGDPTPQPKHTRTPQPESHDDDEKETRPAPYLDLTHACTAAGTTFTIINYGGDMQGAEPYHLSDGTSGEYQLNWNESQTITAGFGTVTMDAGAAGSLSVECQRPPELTISGMCVPDTGVVYTIRNSGGPMLEPQVYTLNNTLTDTFWLGEDGQVEIEAGFGDPVFFSEGLTTQMGTFCKPSGSISGMVYSDVDGDSTRGPDEPGLADIEVTLIGDGGPITKKTASDGLFAFEVVPGSYRIEA